MTRANVINISDYKSKKHKLKGNGSTSSLSLTLDTQAPHVDVIPNLSVQDGTVSFDFNIESSDTIEYKTWGDYDVTASGINHDLCGTTELNAPWVQKRNSVDYSLSPSVQSISYNFYFKFRDDVFNEFYIPIEGEVERTLLIDVEDFVQSKEQYLTFVLDADQSLYDDFYSLDTRFFDTFIYTEAVTDNPSARPVSVFGFERHFGNELITFDVFTGDNYKSTEDGVISIPRLDFNTKTWEHGYTNNDLLLQDAGKLSTSIQFINSGKDVETLNDSGIINATYSDAGGPYGVFFYFSVKLVQYYGGTDALNINQLVSDEFLSHDATEIIIGQRDEGLLHTDIYFTNKFKVSEEPKVDSNFIMGQSLFEDSLTYMTVVPSLFSKDIFTERNRFVIDVDYLLQDAGKLGVKFITTIPSDSFFISEDYSIISLALSEIGYTPQPTWDFDVKGKEIVTGDENLMANLLGRDYFTSDEWEMLLMPLTDVGIIPDPEWKFEVNSIDFVTGKEYLVTDLLSIDYSKVYGTYVNSVFSSDAALSWFHGYYDADLLQYDYTTGSDVEIFDLMVSDEINSSEFNALNLYGIDYFTATDKLIEFGKISKDLGTGSEYTDFMLPGTDHVYSEDVGVINLVNFDVVNQHEHRPIIDADLLMKDDIFAKETQFISLMGQDIFIAEDVNVIEIWSWVNYVANYHVDIHEIQPVPPEEWLFVFDEGFGKELHTTIELKQDDGETGHEDVVIILAANDSAVYKDILPLFEKTIQDSLFGTENLTEISLMGTEYVDSVFTPMLNVMGSDIFTSIDLLTEFKKDSIDYGTGNDPDTSIYVPISYSSEIRDESVLSMQSRDDLYGRDLLVQFIKNFFDLSLGKDNVIIDQLTNETGFISESGVIDVALSEFGLYNEKQKITCYLIQRDLIEGIDRIYISPIGREIIYTNETAMLLPCVFEKGKVKDIQKIRAYLIQKDLIPAFDQATISLVQTDFLKSDVETIITLATMDAGYASFAYDIEIVENVVYVDVFELGFGSDAFVQMDLTAEDAGTLYGESVISFFKSDYFDVTERVKSIDKLFKVTDAGDGCYNTIIYDPTIDEQRDLIYWWEPGYMPGGHAYYSGEDPSGTHFIVNPDWGKPILPSDIDYPLYRDDPGYGGLIEFLADSNRMNTYASWDGSFEWVGDRTLVEGHYIDYKTLNILNYSFQHLFTSYAPTFKFGTQRATVTETYLVTTGFIPWNTTFAFSIECHHYKSPGNYESLGKKIIPTSYLIKARVWSSGNICYTTYEFVPENQLIDCYEYFPNYDLSKDYFTVDLYCGFNWYDKWYHSVRYKIDAFYVYYGYFETISKTYLEARRQVIYNDDQWFVPQDISYYEPTVFKLYINLGCGILDAYDRPPESVMDKFVLDKMMKYSKLDIVASYLGDHAVISEDPIISLYHKVDIKYHERWDISYTLYFKDVGYSCEDTVVYSRSDFQDREILYWWNDGYPIAHRPSDYDPIPNPLIGDDIRPGDFDYPYTIENSMYGQIIKPHHVYSIPNFNPYSYSFKETCKLSDYPYVFYNRKLVIPLLKVTDGMTITLKGRFRANIGKVKISIAGFTDYSKETLLDPVPFDTLPYIHAEEYFELSSSIYTTKPHYNPYVVKELGTIEAIKSGPIDGEYTFKPVDLIISGVTCTFRLQDLVNALGNMSGRGFYACVILDVDTTDIIVNDPTIQELDDTWGYSYALDFSASCEEYDPYYLKYRAPGMEKVTDGEFVVTDFYPDLFKFKFYVNHGCDFDLDAFPINPVDDFERWVFNKARKGNYNLDYLYSGDNIQYYEYPLVEIFKELYLKMSFRVYFNNFEFTVFEYGSPEISAFNSLMGDDTFVVKEHGPIIDIPETLIYNSDYHLQIQVNHFLHEHGTFVVTPFQDLLTADTNNAFNEFPIISQEKTIDVKATFGVSFYVKFMLYENILSVTKDFLAVPIDEMFLYSDGTTIELPQVHSVESKEHTNLVEFIFVFEEGDFTADPLLYDIYDETWLFNEETIMNLALAHRSIAKERIWPDRKELYQEVGYVCFWVQLVNYPYVIDWLAGHFVDYYEDVMEAEYFRFTSCFGIPPGGWPQVSNYPSPSILPDDRIPHLVKDPNDPSGGYRWWEPKPTITDRGAGGYIRTPGPGDDVTYIINPANPPGPYKWVGGTSIFFTKTILDLMMQQSVLVTDAFYFALFDEFGNRVSGVKTMTMKESLCSDGTRVPGASFGAMVFYNLDPFSIYYIRETDKRGNILNATYTSDHSGNVYSLPKDGLAIATKEEGECVDAGDLYNLIEKFGPGNLKPIPNKNDNYDPRVYPSGYGGKVPPGAAPFEIPDHGNPFPSSPIKPHVDGGYGPPIIPPEYDPDVPDDDPIDVPGYEGKLNHVYEYSYVKESSVLSVPVEMLAVIWEYHYIPANFILELSGMRLEFEDDFEFELISPFKFDSTDVLFEIEEPFRFDGTEFYVNLETGFLFDEDPFEINTYLSAFHLDELKFDFYAQFEDFDFEWVDYDGEQLVATPQVISNVLTYNGEMQNLCYAKGSHGSILYQVDDEPWSMSVPQKMEAGSYTVRWYAMASLYYQGYGTQADYLTTNCVIQRAPAEIFIDKLTLVYGTEREFTFVYTGDGTVSCKSEDNTVCLCEIVSQEKILSGNKSRYKVTIKVVGKSYGFCNIRIICTSGVNYAHTEKLIDCTVTAAEITFTALPVDVLYTGDVPESRITVFGPTEYEILYSDHYITPENTDLYRDLSPWKNVGDYMIYFIIKSLNYKPVTGKFRLTVGLIPQTIEFVPYTGIYDGQEHNLIEKVMGVFGTIWYSLDGDNWSADIPKGMNPGVYVIYWYSVGDADHYDMGTQEFPNVYSVIIGKMNIDTYIENQVVDLGYTDPIVVDIPTPSTGAMRVTCSDYTAVSCELLPDNKLLITGLNVGGSFVYIYQAEDALYNAHTFSFYVECVSTLIVYETTSVITTYNGEAVMESGVTVLNPSPDLCTVLYAKEPIGPGVRLSPTPDFYLNAGTYTIYFAINSPGYITAYGSYELIINKAVNRFVVHGIDVLFDADDHDLVEIEPGYHGRPYFSHNMSTYTYIMPQAMMPNSYLVYCYCDGGLNYESVGSPGNPIIVTSIIRKLDIDVPSTTLDINVNAGEQLINIPTPSTGTISQWSVNPGTYVKNVYVSVDYATNTTTLHVTPKAVGRTVIRIHQNASAIYNDYWFEYIINTVNEGPTTTGQFFSVLGDAVTNTGYLAEELSSTRLRNMINTGAIYDGDKPFAGACINFYDMFYVNHNLMDLIGAQFFVNCCSHNCPWTIIFTDEHEFTVTDDGIIYVGIKDDLGNYYTDASDFIRQFIDNNIGGHINFGMEIKSSDLQFAALWIYDFRAGEPVDVGYFCDSNPD